MKILLHSRRKRHAHGLSLIEVLVGVLLISFGLLGLISLLGRSVQFSVVSEDSLRATLLANEMAATIVSQQASTAGAIALDAATLTAWQTAVANPSGKGLPNGVGAVTVSGRTAQISVQWRAPSAAASAVNNYATAVVLP